MYDHRRLGRELELFDSDPLIGAGLPYWLPKGAAIKQSLEEYILKVERLAGYQHVSSPCSANASSTRYQATGRTTATTCSRRWTSVVRRWSSARASAHTTR